MDKTKNYTFIKSNILLRYIYIYIIYKYIIYIYIYIYIEVAIESWYTTDFPIPFRCSDRLYSYSNFIVCSVPDPISAIAFASHHVYFNRSFVEVITQL